MQWYAKVPSTDKETDKSWEKFILWKVNSGLVWAAVQYCEKKFGAYYEELLRLGFLCFHGQKNENLYFENTVVSSLKSCIVKVKKKYWQVFFTEEKTIFRAKNFNISTKTLSPLLATTVVPSFSVSLPLFWWWYVGFECISRFFC